MRPHWAPESRARADSATASPVPGVSGEAAAAAAAALVNGTCDPQHVPKAESRMDLADERERVDRSAGGRALAQPHSSTGRERARQALARDLLQAGAQAIEERPRAQHLRRTRVGQKTPVATHDRVAAGRKRERDQVVVLGVAGHRRQRGGVPSALRERDEALREFVHAPAPIRLPHSSERAASGTPQATRVTTSSAISGVRASEPSDTSPITIVDHAEFELANATSCSHSSRRPRRSSRRTCRSHDSR